MRNFSGASACADPVIRAMETAKKYIPRVGIETPMTREFNRVFREAKNCTPTQFRSIYGKQIHNPIQADL